jgi:anti-sigma B factor antagonist
VPSLDVSEVSEGRVRVLELSGELEISTIRSLQNTLIDAVEGHGCVVLDCMELTFIDSSGMRLLLGALRVVDRARGCLLLACANPTVLRLFSLTGMDRTFEILPSRDGAIGRALEASTV